MEHPEAIAPGACPACGASGLHAVSDGELVNLRCPTCKRCWHVELGRIARVAPATCPGCAHLEECLAVARAEGLA